MHCKDGGLPEWTVLCNEWCGRLPRLKCELTVGTGPEVVCLRSCCRPSDVITFLLTADQTQELGSH